MEKKTKIKLTMSKPVRSASSNKQGGFQNAGTKSGSVSPKSDMNRLVRHIAVRCCGYSAYSSIHGMRNALDQASQT